MSNPVTLLWHLREDSGCLTFTECILVSCMGLLTLGLGIILITHNTSYRISMATGVCMVALGLFLLTLRVLLTYLRVNEDQEGLRNQGLEAQRSGSPESSESWSSEISSDTS